MSEDKTTMAEALILLIVVLYNFSLVAGATFLVITYEWSMWTYLLALCFVTSVRTGKAAEKHE